MFSSRYGADLRLNRRDTSRTPSGGTTVLVSLSVLWMSRTMPTADDVEGPALYVANTWTIGCLYYIIDKESMLFISSFHLLVLKRMFELKC